MTKATHYYYKNIYVFQYWGTWQADYVTESGRRTPLHRHCMSTKAKALECAKRLVDLMNT